MAINRVGSVAKGDTGGVGASSVAATWGATTTAGNFLIAIVETRAIGVNTPTFTAPAGWTAAPPTRAGASGGSNQDPSCQIWYIANCGVRSGSESFSWTGTAEAILYLAEYSGLPISSPYDTEGNFATSATQTNVQTGTTAALALANSLCVGAVAVKNQSRTLTTPQNGYTLVRTDSTTDATNANGITTGYLELIGGTAGATTTTGLTANVASQHTGVLAVFKPAVGGSTVTGAAALSGTGSSTTAGVRTRLGAAALTGAGSSTVAGVRKRIGAAALSGSGTVAAAGTRTRFGAAALTGNGTLAAAGTRTRLGTVAMTGTGSATITGVRTRFAASALAGSGTLTAAGTRTRYGAAALPGQGTLTATGARVSYGLAALTGLGLLVATGTRGSVGAADLVGYGTLTVNTVAPAISFFDPPTPTGVAYVGSGVSGVFAPAEPSAAAYDAETPSPATFGPPAPREVRV